MSCFCGTDFESDSPFAICPKCGEPAAVPKLTMEDMNEMASDVDEVLSEHEEPPWRIA